MTSMATWLGLVTLALSAILLKRGVKSAVIVGVLFAPVLSWVKGTS